MDSTRNRPIARVSRWSNGAGVATATVAVIALLHFARDALVPVVLAGVVALMLSSIVDVLVGWRMPRWLAAAIVVTALVIGAGSCLNAVWEPARNWLDRAPHTLRTAEQKLRPLTRLVAKVESVSDQAARMASPAASDGADPPVKVRDDTPGLVNLTLSWVVTLVATVFMTYFLLADGPTLLTRISRRSRRGGPRRAVAVVLGVRRVLGRYFGAMAMSSLALGLATTVVMFALDMPSPILWGTLAFLLNFVPYAGPTIMFVLLVLVALVSFDGIGPTVAVGASFLLLTTLEGQLLQPVLVGRRIRVSPLAVMLALWFGGWLWGLPGVALAAPILAVARTLLDVYRRDREEHTIESGSGALLPGRALAGAADYPEV